MVTDTNGTPSCWENIWEIFLSKQDMIRYDIFHTHLLHGTHSRITDYKGVWGLLGGVEKGEAECAYFTDEGKTYIGIRKTADLTLIGRNSSNVILLLPSGTAHSSQSILDMLAENNADFQSDSYETAFAQVTDLLWYRILHQTLILR